ncbi:MAG TPA: DUF5691 domain-containing protein [Xanthomonadaceae bacterium]|jgi:hypothetical protein
MIAAWLNQALVGVDRAPPVLGGEIGDLLARVGAQGDDPALGFSRAMGALAACHLAALTLAVPDAPPPEPAQADANVLAADHAWSALLAWVFAEGTQRLQHEACLRIATLHAVVPVSLLPAALDAGRRSTALRPALQSVIGHRGRWLAQFNDDWRFAKGGTATVVAADDPKMWSEGGTVQRIDYLRALRARDPGAARELLKAQLGEMPAKERIELVGVVAQHLGPDDEALLELLLKDRSRDVRDAAARLLALLPSSAHARRLAGWLAAAVTSKRSFLLKTTWSCDAPQAADPAWATAAIDAARPQHEALGERAWWLYQLTRQSALSWWKTHTGMNATDLIAWAAKTDWKDALYRGWRERAGAADRDWIEAMLCAPDPEFRRHASSLLALLPVSEREKYWPRSLADFVKSGALGDATASCALGETLSTEFSRTLLLDVHALIAGDHLRNDYNLRPQLLELATILHPASLVAWHAAARRDDETPAMSECIHTFERIIAIRHSLHAPLP